MNWSGLGLHGWDIRLRELEHFARGVVRIAREEPEDKLPGAELPDNEQQAALHREVRRRTVARQR